MQTFYYCILNSVGVHEWVCYVPGFITFYLLLLFLKITYFVIQHCATLSGTLGKHAVPISALHSLSQEKSKVWQVIY